MSSNSRVSVIVPIFNAENVLRTTMDALVGQTLSNTEIICVNDGSTDSSGEILEDYRQRYRQVRVITTENRGAFNARETGMQSATGDYIAFCDAGDAPDEDMYEKLLFAATSSGAGISICGYRRLEDHGVGADEMVGFGDSVLDVDAGSGWIVSVNTSLWNKLIRSDVLQSRVCFSRPPRIMEDAMLLLSIYPKAKSVVFVPESLYSYNVEQGSAMGRVEPDEIDVLFEDWQITRSHAESEVPGFEYIIDLAVFVHMGISAQLRLVLEGSRESLSVCKSIDRKIDALFPLHRNSPFIEKSYVSQFPSMRNVRLAHMAYTVHLKTTALKAYGGMVRKRGMKSTW